MESLTSGAAAQCRRLYKMVRHGAD